MITIKNTENLVGVSISGDFNDLDRLVEAFYTITIDEFAEKNKRYLNISNRILGLSYEVRHALQGDREIELVENGMDEEKMKFHSIITPRSNVYYKCNYLYPEMFFVVLALNELVRVRIKELTKTKYIYNEALDKNVIWDETISVIRSFQAQFTKCLKEVLTPVSFSRWLKFMNSDYIYIEDIKDQYLDMLNIKYIHMSKEKRLKNLNTIAKRIIEYSNDSEYCEIREVIIQGAKDYGCHEADIRLKGIEYPDEILW